MKQIISGLNLISRTGRSLVSRTDLAMLQSSYRSAVRQRLSRYTVPAEPHELQLAGDRLTHRQRLNSFSV